MLLEFHRFVYVLGYILNCGRIESEISKMRYATCMKHDTSHIVTHLFTLVWYCIALALLSLAVFVFLNGSSVFTWNRDRIAVRAHVEQKNDQLYVSGSFTPIEPCSRVHMVDSTIPGRIELVATIPEVCDDVDRNPITFVAELPVIDTTYITVALNGVLLPVDFQ